MDFATKITTKSKKIIELEDRLKLEIIERVLRNRKKKIFNKGVAVPPEMTRNVVTLMISLLFAKCP